MSQTVAGLRAGDQIKCSDREDLYKTLKELDKENYEFFTEADYKTNNFIVTITGGGNEQRAD